MATAALVGCEGKPAQPALPPKPGELPEVVLKTPEDAARSALVYLRADLRAVAHRDRQTEEKCLERLRTIAALAAIEQEFAKQPQLKGVVGEPPVEGYITNWAAAIAYYAEGFHFDQMRRSSETPAEVAVVVPASGPEDDALIQVSCIREDDGPWRVSRIEFIVEPAITRPASQPASQSP
jgi:hypothetical protein